MDLFTATSIRSQGNEYSRGSGPLVMKQHNYNEGTTYGVFIQDLIGLNDQLKLMLVCATITLTFQPPTS